MEHPQLHFSKRKPAKCPACGSLRVARIVYGYPGPELIQDLSLIHISEPTRPY